jgi:hypothetical protein
MQRLSSGQVLLIIGFDKEQCLMIGLMLRYLNGLLSMDTIGLVTMCAIECENGLKSKVSRNILPWILIWCVNHSYSQQLASHYSSQSKKNGISIYIETHLDVLEVAADYEHSIHVIQRTKQKCIYQPYDLNCVEVRMPNSGAGGTITIGNGDFIREVAAR